MIEKGRCNSNIQICGVLTKILLTCELSTDSLKLLIKITSKLKGLRNSPKMV